MGEDIFFEIEKILLEASCVRHVEQRGCGCLDVCKNDMDRLDGILGRSGNMLRGDILFREGEPFDSIFAIRSGSLKVSMMTRQGREQVTGFYCPGDLVGLDCIGLPNYACTARALEKTTVNPIKFSGIERLSLRFPVLQRYLIHAMSAEIRNSRAMTRMAAMRTAEERVVNFLMFLGSRFENEKALNGNVRLALTDDDIGSLMGLTGATIRRTALRFQLFSCFHQGNEKFRTIDQERLVGLSCKFCCLFKAVNVDSSRSFKLQQLVLH